MKYILALRNRGISAILAGVLIAGTASLAYAESGGNTPAAPSEKQAPSGWNKTETSGGGWLSSIFGGSADASAPDKAETSSGWSSARDGNGSCRHSSDEEEDFLCKLVRIFWGTDRPYGPNRDMDDNISAGGAGG